MALTWSSIPSAVTWPNRRCGLCVSAGATWSSASRGARSRRCRRTSRSCATDRSSGSNGRRGSWRTRIRSARAWRSCWSGSGAACCGCPNPSRFPWTNCPRPCTGRRRPQGSCGRSSLRSVGPLNGVRVVEIGSIGPDPFAAMMLADMGADVLRLERPDAGGLSAGRWNVMNRGRRSAAVDLKHPEGRELVLRLIEAADTLIVGFRPGVMERLGLGPDEALARRPQLVYGRTTGYGQTGPMSSVAGHDINYIALSGALGAMARRGERPLFPLNLIGDYGGGGLLLAFGIVCALRETATRGSGRSSTQRWSRARRYS